VSGADISTVLGDMGLSPDAGELDSFEKYADLLSEWGKVHNLTGDLDRERIYENIADSLYPVSFVPEPKSMIDIGSGAGFPGLVLAIHWRGCGRVVLCEPRAKRASFLRYAVIELGLESVEVARKRVEDLKSAPFGLICSRAVTETSTLFSIAGHLADGKSSFLLYKGSRLDRELEKSGSESDCLIHSRGARNYLYCPATDK
jgi:16S rRNA (guanine527-N7)-methyltransferase